VSNWSRGSNLWARKHFPKGNNTTLGAFRVCCWNGGAFSTHALQELFFVLGGGERRRTQPARRCFIGSGSIPACRASFPFFSSTASWLRGGDKQSFTRGNSGVFFFGAGSKLTSLLSLLFRKKQMSSLCHSHFRRLFCFSWFSFLSVFLCCCVLLSCVSVRWSILPF